MTEEYYRYLKNVSWKGAMYRKYLLYPRLNKYCGEQVLDVGCGTGAFLQSLPRSRGVDINMHCVEHCKKLGLNAELMIEDKLDFSDSFLILWF